MTRMCVKNLGASLGLVYIICIMTDISDLETIHCYDKYVSLLIGTVQSYTNHILDGFIGDVPVLDDPIYGPQVNETEESPP